MTNADDELEILDVFMIPELHIFTGIVNRLVQALNEKWNWDNGHQDAFYKWCDKLNILYTGFHGKVWSMTCIHFAPPPSLQQTPSVFSTSINVNTFGGHFQAFF